MFESVKKEAKRSAKGFTLIELLVVVVIVGILAAVALPNFLGQSGKARTTEATAAIDGLKSGQEVFLNENGNYLTSGTVSAVAAPTGPADNMATATFVTTPAVISTVQASLGINLDSSKFSGTATTGTVWNVATIGATNTNFEIRISGGAPGTNPLAGLASAYQKSQARVWTDGNSTV